jgi:hypothetical protein
MAQTLQELPVYLEAREFSAAVAAIIARPAFGRNRKLREQIADANESILAKRPLSVRNAPRSVPRFSVCSAAGAST